MDDAWDAFGSESESSSSCCSSSDDDVEVSAAGKTAGGSSTTTTEVMVAPLVKSSSSNRDDSGPDFEVFDLDISSSSSGNNKKRRRQPGPSRGGKGLRSLRSYKNGDEILREYATIRVPNFHAADSLQKAKDLHVLAVREAYDALSPLYQDSVMALSNCRQQQPNSNNNTDDQQTINQRLEGIYQTNSYRLGTDDQREGGLFLTFARINHSCNPNASHLWRPDLNQLLLFATRDIQIGDELSISYLPINKSNNNNNNNNQHGSGGGGGSHYYDTKQRRAFLRKDFCFHCMCEMCVSADDDAGDDKSSSSGKGDDRAATTEPE